MMNNIIKGMIGNRLPEADIHFCYVLQWLYEEDGQRPPFERIVSDVKIAIDEMIKIFNAPKTLVHISLSRRNA